METNRMRFPDDPAKVGSVGGQKRSDLDESEIDDEAWEETEADWGELDGEIEMGMDSGEVLEWSRWEDDDPADVKPHRTTRWD